MSPAVENNLSQGVFVAGMQRLLLASAAILGNLNIGSCRIYSWVGQKACEVRRDFGHAHFWVCQNDSNDNSPQ